MLDVTILLYIVNSPVLFFGAFFLFRAALWGVIEYFWSARPVAYRKVAAKDFAAQLFHVFLIIPLVVYLYDRVFASYPQPQILQEIPIALRIVLYLLLGDLGYYWMHRLMYTNVLWQAHKWHHSPTYMYWLAGCRATITQQFLVGVPYVLASPVLNPSPWWIYTGLAIFSYLNVDWMHLNTPWGTVGWNGSLLRLGITTSITAPTRSITTRIWVISLHSGIACLGPTSIPIRSPRRERSYRLGWRSFRILSD